MLRTESIASVVQNRFREIEFRLAELEAAVARLTAMLSGNAAVAVAPGGRATPGTD